MERDQLYLLIIVFGLISTHTLTWSVTSEGISTVDPSLISTHTLTWSVTNGRRERPWARYISTHTLTWSVTAEVAKYAVKPGDFNSHAHVERD